MAKKKKIDPDVEKEVLEAIDFHYTIIDKLNNLLATGVLENAES